MKTFWLLAVLLMAFGVLVLVFVENTSIFFWSDRIFGDQTSAIQESETEPELDEDPNGEVMLTGELRHTVPLKDIVSGGVPKDGIPSIDNPKFVLAAEAGDWLSDQEPGLAFLKGNTQRFYPYQILVWHEIVNDVIEGERVLITYCPLCLTGIVFDPMVKGERAEFGTSGMLWKSNLVMYDRKTNSLWSQILGQAIAGEMAGVKLNVLPSDQMRFVDFKRNYPQGLVLSRDTGQASIYGTNPYGEYFSAPDFALSLADFKDTRLPADNLVFGLVINGKAKAYSIESVRAKGFLEDFFEGRNFVLRRDENLNVVRVYERLGDGQEKRIIPFSAFWFSWVSAHPETELYK